MALRRKSQRTPLARVERDGVLAALVAERRLDLRLSQAELADLAEVGQNAVVNLEAGRPVRIEILTAVLNALGLRLEVTRGASPTVGVSPELTAIYRLDGPADE
ncbi:helix-turn-helix domain-containing protein [Nocardioides sp.]|uniref:helix-turn-helix domain-containing protein n=1 Tax=Nocardioides sp. TaxID=35761 RepID=UPI002603A3EB|nr:helix-turn-helix domain-containing protein [Nocardioides sp.]